MTCCLLLLLLRCDGEDALLRDLDGPNNQYIYIYGELTNWDILHEAKMQYNEKENYYYGTLYLKQGYYNYKYITTDLNNKNMNKLRPFSMA